MCKCLPYHFQTFTMVTPPVLTGHPTVNGDTPTVHTAFSPPPRRRRRNQLIFLMSIFQIQEIDLILVNS